MMQLYINSYGTYVHVKDDMFEIRVPVEGPDKQYIKHHFTAKKVSSIMLPKSVALSSDAVILALKNNVDILFVEYDGQPLGRIWHSKLGSTTRIRKMQLQASLDSEGLKWVKKWIINKVQNQIDFLKDLKKHRQAEREYLDEKISRIQNLNISVSLLDGQCTNEVAETIRGLEGTAGRLYFETISHVIPINYRFSGRSSRPAKDQFNAFLNYAYGILYGRTEKCLMVAGIDPYIGFLHRDDYNQLSMVFDFIEPYRIHAETAVFRLFSSKKVKNTHTDQFKNGLSLNAEGKALLVERFNNYFDVETIRYRGRNQTRANAMQMDAHIFANSMIKTPFDEKLFSNKVL
jgi:CRISP-associated protein Cas1